MSWEQWQVLLIEKKKKYILYTGKFKTEEICKMQQKII